MLPADTNSLLRECSRVQPVIYPIGTPRIGRTLRGRHEQSDLDAHLLRPRRGHYRRYLRPSQNVERRRGRRLQDRGAALDLILPPLGQITVATLGDGRVRNVGGEDT